MILCGTAAPPPWRDDWARLPPRGLTCQSPVACFTCQVVTSSSCSPCICISACRSRTASLSLATAPMIAEYMIVSGVTKFLACRNTCTASSVLPTRDRAPITAVNCFAIRRKACQARNSRVGLVGRTHAICGFIAACNVQQNTKARTPPHIPIHTLAGCFTWIHGGSLCPSKLNHG
jgi:hypothetical protein